MRSRANLPIFIAYALLGLLATAFMAAQMGGEFVLGGYRVNAIFKTGAELVAGHQFGAGLEDGVHPVAAEHELAAHLGSQEGGGQQSQQGVGDEDRQVGPAPHRPPPSSTRTTASNASATWRLLPVGRVQGTPGLQAPTTTLMRVA